MAQLRFFYVDCNDQQEAGGDEIYFTFHDNGGWGEGRTNTIKDMDAGERFYMTDRFNFSGSVDVRLYEQDPANPDDFIDSTTLYFSWSENGDNKTVVFSGAGANYDVRYEIVA